MATNKKHVLDGGGEMGELIRTYDWASTTLGPIDTWPSSLLTTLGLLLHTRFPMFLMWGPDLICFYNDAYRPSLGRDGKHPAVGKKGADVWSDIWDFVAPLIDDVMTTGNPVYFEDQLVTFYRNGRNEDIYWTFSHSPVYGDDGCIHGVLVTCMETTKNVQTIQRLVESERALQESEHRLRGVIESAPFPIGIYAGREMRIVFVNQAILDVWGKGTDVVGKRYAEVLPELESQQIYPQLDRVFTTGIPFHARDQRVDLFVDGRLQPFYFNYSFTPLYDAQGAIYGVMNTAADLTDLHVALQQVEQSEKNLRNMVLQAPVAMCIMLGPEHVVEVANDLMIELWGKPKETVMNRPIFEALPEARDQGLEPVMANVYRTGEPFTAHERPVNLMRNGKLEAVYQNFVYEAYRDSDGTILGVLAITIDVTEMVLARQKIEDVVAARTHELEVANQELARSNAELAQFAYIASHDIQEPLRKIRTFAQMLEKSLGTMLDGPARGFLDKIQTSAARMHLLIRDVLTYSELDHAHEGWRLVDLNEVLETIETDLELVIEEKGAVIVAEKLPTVWAVPLQMAQLFGNLLANALKFTRPGIRPTITITAHLAAGRTWEGAPLPEPEKMYHMLSLRDNGIGFKPELAGQIFHIFQRLHRKAEFEGTGIGLAICKKIALRHQGDIHAFGSSEYGAVFTLALPLADA